jgi:FixJ family two-component response regulator/tRNA A-37 threonylcarbamoyl transferase component Bud32
MILCSPGFINLSCPGRIATVLNRLPMRILIIDESSESRAALAGLLRARWPEAQVDEWDPRRHGNPADAIARGRYSAVLLDSRPAGEDGIRWVEEMRKRPQAPPVVLIADQGDTHAAIQAMKAGAADFLRRADLTPEHLAHALENALREHEVRRQESTGTHSPFARTVPLDLRRIGVPLRKDALSIPGYRTLRMIGEGGMAQVYLAERIHDGIQLVLKVLDPALRRDSTFLQRFVREYQLIVSLENEHVARVFDQGFAGEQPYIAMEYLPGGTLAARIHEGMSSLAALRLTSQIAKALDAIHSRDIVHRDLKPQNIMFRESGRPVIVDFGLAKDLDSDSNLTRFGEVLATPRYMSPEQCMGEPADARSDLYSLGAIFYEMIAGQRLFGDAGPAEMVHLHVHGEIPRLPDHLAGYQTIIDRLLAKNPEHRFQSARELFATIAV